MRALKWFPGPPGLYGFLVELQPEAVGKPRQVIEDSHDVSDLQAGFVIEPQIAERFPIRLHHLRRLGAELFCYFAEGALALGKGKLVPATFLDRLD